MDHAERVSLYRQDGEQSIPQKDGHCSHSNYQKVIHQLQWDDRVAGEVLITETISFR